MYEQRLVELGLTLPAAAVPSFNYVPVAIHNGVAWVAGQLPKVGQTSCRTVSRCHRRRTGCLIDI